MPLIVQHGIGDCAELLRLSAAHHAAYATRHNHTLIQDMSQRCPERRAYWEKLPMLLHVLTRLNDGHLLAWLDADCLIVDPDVNIFAGFSADIAMTTVSYPGIPEHFNTGVILLKNSPKIRELLQHAFAAWPNDVPMNAHPKHDELAINEAIVFFNKFRLHGGVSVAVLPPEMNCWKHNQKNAQNPVIRAWHGMPNDTVRKRMAEELEKIACPIPS